MGVEQPLVNSARFSNEFLTGGRKELRMGLPAITAVAGSLFSKLEGLASHKAKATPTPQASSTSDASSVSNPGMLFSQLQSLSQQNPTEFKKITAQVAQNLQTASAGSSSPAGVLSQMASNFQHASQTGSFSDLFTHSPQTASQQAAATAASGHPHQQYAQSNGAADTSSLSSIFSQALSQIKTDLSSAA